MENDITAIAIKNLVLPCSLGVTEKERAEKQTVVINIVMWIKRINDKDDIVTTVNYQEVYDHVVEFVNTSSLLLVETYCEEIAKICLSFSMVVKVKVTIDKVKVLKLAQSARIEVTREK